MMRLKYIVINQQCFQVLLINAVKDVASALSDLISATKNASGKNVQDPAMMHLKDSAKVGVICCIFCFVPIFEEIINFVSVLIWS